MGSVAGALATSRQVTCLSSSRSYPLAAQCAVTRSNGPRWSSCTELGIPPKATQRQGWGLSLCHRGPGGRLGAEVQLSSHCAVLPISGAAKTGPESLCGLVQAALVSSRMLRYGLGVWVTW